MKKTILLLLAVMFVASNAYCTTVVKPMSKAQLKKWAHKLALSVKKYMWDSGERFITMHQPQGKPYAFEVTVEFLEERIIDDYDAARFNPAWGPRPLACIKELDYQYGESRWDRYAVNINRIGSIDLGLGQINSCHFVMLDGAKSCAYINFCKMMKLEPNLKWIWSAYFNSLFSAYLNEDFIKNGARTYKYYDNLPKQNLYDVMVKTTGLKELALQYNDGQYFDKEEVKNESRPVTVGHWYSIFTNNPLFRLFRG